MHERAHPHTEHRPARHGHPYRRLGAMVAVSFVAMFFLMYAMVDRWEHVVPNLNQVWMAGLMAAPMALIELAAMPSMYPDAKRNRTVVAVSLLAMLLCWVGIREQVGIGDRELLRSMIPHHAGALLMCRGASLTDPSVTTLCRSIEASQAQEIALMRELLAGAPK